MPIIVNEMEMKDDVKEYAFITSIIYMIYRIAYNYEIKLCQYRVFFHEEPVFIHNIYYIDSKLFKFTRGIVLSM